MSLTRVQHAALFTFKRGNEYLKRPNGRTITALKKKGYLSGRVGHEMLTPKGREATKKGVFVKPYSDAHWRRVNAADRKRRGEPEPDWSNYHHMID
jgi:hypothetical protein